MKGDESSLQGTFRVDVNSTGNRQILEGRYVYDWKRILNRTLPVGLLFRQSMCLRLNLNRKVSTNLETVAKVWGISMLIFF